MPNETPKDELTLEAMKEALADSVSDEHIIPLKQLIEKAGGVDRAQEALDRLTEFKDAA